MSASLSTERWTTSLAIACNSSNAPKDDCIITRKTSAELPYHRHVFIIWVYPKEVFNSQEINVRSRSSSFTRSKHSLLYTNMFKDDNEFSFWVPKSGKQYGKANFKQKSF